MHPYVVFPQQDVGPLLAIEDDDAFKPIQRRLHVRAYRGARVQVEHVHVARLAGADLNCIVCVFLCMRVNVHASACNCRTPRADVAHLVNTNSNSVCISACVLACMRVHVTVHIQSTISWCFL